MADKQQITWKETLAIQISLASKERTGQSLANANTKHNVKIRRKKHNFIGLQYQSDNKRCQNEVNKRNRSHSKH